jgi:hypothetical protein
VDAAVDIGQREWNCRLAGQAGHGRPRSRYVSWGALAVLLGGSAPHADIGVLERSGMLT